MTAPSRTTRSRFRPFAQVGLRARITIAFTLGALLVSLVLIGASVVLIRQNLLSQRERLVAERARQNARLVADKIASPNVDTQTVFGSLSTAGTPSIMFKDASTGSYVPVSFDTRFGAKSIPEALKRQVLTDRTAAIMRYSRSGRPLLAVGIPIPNQDAAYFEVSQLDDIAASLRSLLFPLISTSVFIAGLGAGLGWWGSRRVLRPLADITAVATDVAGGRLDARVAYSEWADDADLAPLVSTFNDMVAALQARIDRDARFASDVSHELRSPLTTFNASLQVLQNAHDELPDRAQLALDLLSSDMERFTQLVEDLLEISRFDAGAVRLESDEVLVVDTVGIAARTLGSNPIPITADESLEGIIITLDKRRLVRVLANFIDNAAKYADGATGVVVHRRIHPDPAVDGSDDRAWVEIAVEDEGPGVPEGERERIFDRFNRGEMGGRRGNDLGVGLGLALAAEHARLGGGRVWVEPRTDGHGGSRFIVELPLVEADDLDDVDEMNDELGLDEVIVGPTRSEVSDTGVHAIITVDGNQP